MIPLSLRTPCLLPVIHIKDNEQALLNTRVALEAGCDGVFLICHDDKVGEPKLRDAVSHVRSHFPRLWIGANMLGLMPADALRQVPAEGNGLWCDFIGIDEDLIHPEAEEAQKLRANWRGLYFGSVAFKYQAPVHDLERMTALCAPFTDVVTTSGEATGDAPSVDKIKRMREVLNPLQPLAIASGITPENVDAYLPFADIFMVATGIGRDFHNLDPDKTRALAAKIGRRISS